MAFVENLVKLGELVHNPNLLGYTPTAIPVHRI
jgi:uncharacterized protein (UPF0248 family)